MCKYDEAFTEQEMLEETGYCKTCKMNCQNAGKVFVDKKYKEVINMSSTTRKKNRSRMEKWKMEALLEKKEEPMPEDGQECRLSIPADEPIDIPEDLDVLKQEFVRPILVSTEPYDSLHPEETIKEFAKNIRAMLERYEENAETIIEMENATQDILHLSEMWSKRNAPDGCQMDIITMEIRKERRRCKNENAILQPVYDLFHATPLLDKLAAVQGDCGKIKRSIAAKGYSIRTNVLDDILTKLQQHKKQRHGEAKTSNDMHA